MATYLNIPTSRPEKMLSIYFCKLSVAVNRYILVDKMSVSTENVAFVVLSSFGILAM